MPNRISANTGNAPVKKLGHTAGNQYGNNAAAGASNVGRAKPKELSAK